MDSYIQKTSEEDFNRARNKALVNEIQHFLSPTVSDLYAPELLDNMKQGAQMLISHIAHKDKIMI